MVNRKWRVTYFWHDNWEKSGILSLKLRRIFQLVKDEYISVNSMIRAWNESGDNISNMWKRQPTGWEAQELIEISTLIRNVVLSDKKDSLHWKQETHKFSAASCYDYFTSNEGYIGPWKSIWSQKVPPKAKFFLWQISHRIIPTLSLLKKKGVIADDLCKWCGSEEENQDHIFWHCSLATQAWDILKSWINIQIETGQGSMNLEYCFKRCANRNFKVGGGICMVAMLWKVWIARNELVYKGIRTSNKALLLLIKHRAFMWGVACNIIQPNLQSLWVIDPEAACKRRVKWELQCHIKKWFSTATLIGFVDAAWKKDNQGNLKAGIGGFLMAKSGKVLFLFSGPSQKNSSYEAEWEAVEFMLKNILRKGLEKSHIALFSDSKGMVSNMNMGIATHDLDTSIMDHMHEAHYFFLHFVRREINFEADSMAREGSKRQSMLAGWPISQ